MSHPLHRWLAAGGLLLCVPPVVGNAQQQGTTVSGRVTNEASVPVPGVSVTVPTLNVGAMTNNEGRYTFSVPATASGQVELTARRIGYVPRTVTITLTGGTVTQDFRLTQSATQLEGVVVTALGVEREKSQLGTAQQQITAEDLTTTKAQNVLQAVQGKLSGVQITGSGTQGGSTNIVIRGVNTIASSNQPLFIVDGIPVAGTSTANADRGGGLANGYDYGNPISDLNPEDIETFTVLKGPNAAAIYGSRAANGAIVITTKRGASGRMRTELTTTYQFERIGLLPDWQDLYGQGAEGTFRWVNGAGGGVCDGCDQSWGPRLDGRLIDQFTGPQQPWVAHPDNVSDFFETGNTFATTLAVSGGTDRANARMSVGVDNIDSYVPNTFFQKNTALLSGGLQVTPRFNTSATLQYVRNTGKNRPGTGYNNSIMEQFFWFGRQVDMGPLKDFRRPGTDNGGPADREFSWNYNYHNNPYYIQHENPLTDTRDRFILSATASYSPLEWLTASLRSGSDIYRFNIDQRFGAAFLNGTYVDPNYEGGFSFIRDYNNEHNTELLLSANRLVMPNLQVDATLGGNVRREQFSTTSTTTAGISVPGIFNVGNAAITPTLAQTDLRRHVNSLYGTLAFTLNDWWTVEGTARNDWSSTLPEENNSYFYPSVNTSVVLTDALPTLQTGWLSYLKVRGSWAEVGTDASPYQLATTFTGNPNKFGGLPQFSLGNTLLEPNLKPEITRSWEAGAEAGFVDGRVTLDATFYVKNTRNQIYAAPISPTAGFLNKLINAGEMRNTGFEALLSVLPLQTEDLTWNVTFNFAKNSNEVVELAPGVERLLLGDVTGRANLFSDVRLEARPGEPFGVLYGAGYLRDANTGQILFEDGLPVHSDFKKFGSIQPDWTGGLSNTVTWRNFSLNALLDIRRGGKMFSYTNYIGTYSGVLENTLEGREADWDDPGLVKTGIDIESCATGSDVDENDPGIYNCINGTANATRVTAEQYWQSFFGNIEPFVYDASYVKLREVRLGIDFPATWANRLRMQAVNLAVTARNLALWTDVPNVDPEFAYSSNNWQGIEYAIPANPKSVGFTLRLTP